MITRLQRGLFTMLSRLTAANIGMVLAGLLLILFGIVFEKYRLVPRRVDGLLEAARLTLKLEKRDAKEFLARQYTYDTVSTPLTRNLDSALVPLTIKGMRLSDSFPFPKVGGGITAIGNTLLLVDRLGSFYAAKPPGSVRKLELPPLPNNIEVYASGNGHIGADDFRVYGIAFLNRTQELAVSHEIFDAERKGTRIGVSLIGFNATNLEAQGGWRTIFKGDVEATGPNVAGGGRIAVDAGGDIYLTIGVYQINGTNIAQSDANLFGKIIRIDRAKQTATVISKGHRNPQGLAITENGDIWSTEHGPSGGDELNRIIAGANYGWPNVTLGTEYGRYRWETDSPVGRHEDYVPPVFAWVPSIAVSNLIEVKRFDVRWKGDLLVSSLKAQSLFRLRFDQGHVMYSEPIWIGQRIRDLVELVNGTIALWTDDGEVLFLNVDEARLNSDRRWPDALGDTMIASCMFCHHFGPTGPADPAPSLSNIFERRIASDNYRYSVALRSKDGKWTEPSLKLFLTDPDRFASGTSMPPRGLTPQQIDEIVATLKRLDEESQQH
jgi:aldose sugar dehydrogenase